MQLKPGDRIDVYVSNVDFYGVKKGNTYIASTTEDPAYSEGVMLMAMFYGRLETHYMSLSTKECRKVGSFVVKPRKVIGPCYLIKVQNQK